MEPRVALLRGPAVGVGADERREIVASAEAAEALALYRAHSCPDAALIGAVAEAPAGTVVLETRGGSQRVLDLLSGEQLPRIC